MAIIRTSSGPVVVDNWGYMLQGAGGGVLEPAVLAASSFDLIVSDFSRDGTGANRFTPAEVVSIQSGPGGPSVAVAYLSIGEASEFRDHWVPAWTSNGLASGNLTGAAPGWLGPNNPDWPESRKVRYWDSDWQNEIFNAAGTGWLDQIVAQGFDAAYLDIVDAYHFWGAEVGATDQQPGDPATLADAAARMIDFVTALTAHARLANPDFFVIPQNGAFIMDDLGADAARRAAYLDAIGAIGVEDVYFSGGLDENNAFSPDTDRVAILQQDFLANGIPVFAVDYVNTGDGVQSLFDESAADGFIGFAAPSRALDQLALILTGDVGNNRLTSGAGDDTLNGNGGNDTLFAGDGNDSLNGGAGNDSLTGGEGADTLNGGAGHDMLFGGLGADVLSGGAGIDYARYNDADYGNLVASLGDVSRNTGAAAGDTYSGVEGLIMGAGRDRAYGDDGDNYIFGMQGHDMLYGGLGADRLNGGAGFDYARYDDTNYGDLIVSLGTPSRNTGAAAGDTFVGIEGLVLGAGRDRGYGDDGDNYLYGLANHDMLYGGLGGDNLNGGSGFDYARYDEADYGDQRASLANSSINTGVAAAGDRYIDIEGLVMGSGNDSAYGNSARNVIYGLAGNDTLSGGGGRDVLIGGSGNDNFIFRLGYGDDTIRDFEGGVGLGDRLALANLGVATVAEALAKAAQVGADTVFTFDSGDTLTLLGITKADLVDDDFLI